MEPLLSVDEALAAVRAHVPEPVPVRAALAASLGQVVAEDLLADHDHPPFPRSKVDGWAVRAADCGTSPLRVVARIAAGTPPGARIGPGEAARVLTGAAVPEGADAVAMQEQCEPSGDRSSVVVPEGAARASHIVPQGAECRTGDPVVRRGDVVTPAVAGAAASAGAGSALVFRAPAVRIVATGDELVPCDEWPGPGRIRNSNAPALAAAAAACGAREIGQRMAPDDDAALRAAFAWALEADLVLVTGGVSVGDLDLVPGVLESMGVRRVLHGVRVQPGKPLWFGTRGRTLVFGLPGNPVSALVNTALFVRTAICLSMGRTPPEPFEAMLGGDLGGGTWRRKFVPASLSRLPSGRVATPIPHQGSGDVFAFARAQCLIEIPEDAPPRPAGAAVACVPLFGIPA